MKLGNAIYHVLSNDANTTAIVDERIYPVVAPQNVLFPLVRFITVNTQVANTKQLDANGDIVRVQVDCIADSYAVSMSLSNAVRSALSYMNGSYNSVKVNASWCIDAEGDYDEKAEKFIQRLEFKFQYEPLT